MTRNIHTPILMGASTVLFLACAACGGGNGSADGPVDAGPESGESMVVGQSPGTERRAAEAEGQSTVHITSVEDGSVVASAEVYADGSFEVPVQAGLEGLLVAVVDAEGEVLGEASLATTGDAGETVYVAPMTAETRLEARVAVAVAAEGEAPDMVEIRSRIDAELAARTDDAEALAAAISAAVEAEARYRAEAGAEATASETSEARITALTEVDAALYAGAAAAAEADAMLAEAERQAWAEAGLTAELIARAESAGSMAARLSTSAVLDGEAHTAAAAQSARVEAWAAHDSLVLSAGELGSTALAEASAALVSELRADSDLQATASAWAGLEYALYGEGAVEPGLLAEIEGVVFAEAVAEGSAEAAEALDVAAEAALSASVDVRGDLDAHALADAVVEAQLAFEQAVAVAGDAGAGSEAALSAAILASGGFRGTTAETR